MQKKKGISLIVLVISIIVMIILAGAIILSLSTTNIFGKAEEAVDKTDMAQIKHIAQLAWADTYLDKDGKATIEELREGVNKALRDNKLNPDDYSINVTENGVDISIKALWIQKGNKVVRGEDELYIGDTIAYTATGTTYKGGWKVLGADTDGNLLIVSSKGIGTYSFGSSLEQRRNGWLNAVNLLNTACEVYGNGTGTVGKARSITMKDIEVLPGMEPPTSIIKGGHGDVITYSWDTTDTSTINYTGKTSSGSINLGDTSFTWYDEETGTYPIVNKDNKTAELPTINCTAYNIDGWGALYEKVDKKIGDVVFTGYFEDDMFTEGYAFSDNYWIATPSIIIRDGEITYSIFGYFDGSVYGDFEMWESSGSYGFDTLSLRPVVTLQADIVLSGSSKAGWTYTVN